MISSTTLATFLGWCTIINFGVLISASLLLVVFRRAISAIHSKMFGLPDVDLARAYFQYLAQYKIAIFVLNLIPYIAVRLMA